MNENNEQVVYSYEGDVSSLRKATQEAVNLIDQYGKAIQKTASLNTFKASATSVKALQKTLSSVSSMVNTVQGALQRTGTSTVGSMSGASQAIESVNVDLRDAVQFMNSLTSATTEDFTLANMVLKDTKDTLGNMTGRVAAATAEVKKLTTAEDTLEKEVEESNEEIEETTKNVKEAGKESEKAGTKMVNSAKKTQNAFSGVNKATRLMGRLFAGLSARKIAQLFTQAVKQSISYIENMNLFKVATGDAYEESSKFISKMAELYGLDPNNLIRYAGNFYQLTDAISMPAAASADLSMGLTKATADIASLFNVDVETVFEDMSSGLQGMSRSVRKYGMDIRATTLQQTALSLGIQANVDTMSEADRIGLRYITMMRQASNASGDLAKTIDEPANQLRIFKEQITIFGRLLGNFFIGPINTAVQYLNGFMMAINTALTYISKLVGVEADFSTGGVGDQVEEDSEDFDKFGGSVSGATKKLKKFLAPFDELTVLTKNMNSSGGVGGGGSSILDPKILAAIQGASWGLEDVEMKAHGIRDSLLDAFGFEHKDGEILSWKYEEDFQGLWDNLDEILDKALQIGVAFAGWKISSTLLGTVAGLVVLIGLLALPYILEDWKAFWGAISGTFQVIWSFFSLDWTGLIEGFNKAWEGFILSEFWSGEGRTADLILAFMGVDYQEIRSQLLAYFGEGGTMITLIQEVIANFGQLLRELFPDGLIGYIIGALWGVNPLTEEFMDPEGNVKSFSYADMLDTDKPIDTPFDFLIFQLREYIRMWRDARAAIDEFIDYATTAPDGIYNVLIKPIITHFQQLLYITWLIWSSIVDAINGSWDSIEEKWGPVVTWFNDTIIKPVSDFFTGLGTSISTAFTTAWTTITTLWSGIETWFKTNVTEPLSKLFGNTEFKIKTPHLSWSYTPMKAGSTVYKILSALGLPTQTPKLNVSWYETGGFPTAGELFVARENGPEMVGRMGSRNAVANNEQIVSGIARGVYDAMIAAGGSRASAQSIVAKVNEKVLFEVLVNANRQETMRTGYNALMEV